MGRLEIADDGNVTMLWKALRPEERIVFNLLRDNPGNLYSLEHICDEVKDQIIPRNNLNEDVKIILDDLLNLRAIDTKDDKYFFPK